LTTLPYQWGTEGWAPDVLVEAPALLRNPWIPVVEFHQDELSLVLFSQPAWKNCQPTQRRAASQTRPSLGLRMMLDRETPFDASVVRSESADRAA
jgi:hypothetical protein